MSYVALFVFLAVTMVAVFAFVSVAVWVAARSKDQQVRDRFALLKAVAEQPGENATRVLQMLREQEDRQGEKERRGFILGGLCTAAPGVALCVMLSVMKHEPGAWTVGLIPLLIGAVLFVYGLSMKPARPSGGP